MSSSSSIIATDSRPSRPPMTDDEPIFSLSRELKPSSSARVGKTPHASTFLARAGSVGLEVLDTFGSSMTKLLSYGGSVSSSGSRGRKVSIFAFEVANTIVKGSNLVQSLSDENIQILKNDILLLEGVQLLVSTEINELLRIAAADKREEFEIFSREVMRFGNMCKDLQWHNLDRILRYKHVTNKLPREEAEITMQELENLAKCTSELYHEYHALDRVEQVHRLMHEEVESLHFHRKGESPMMLRSELKHQRKLVRNLIKKSLWSKNLEEVVEKLVDVVTFIRQAIAEAFGENGKPRTKEILCSVCVHLSAAILTENDKEADKTPERLGVSGLALHYANLITQIDNIASHPMTLHPKMRDTLYNSLPVSVKARLRPRLQALDSKEAMTRPQIKVEMDKTLHWLVPMAINTKKAHQSFGWVGEWANTGFEFGKMAGSKNITRLQTLYHADKHKMDQYILDLVVLLHRLIDKVPKYTCTRSPTLKRLTWFPNVQLQRVNKSLEDLNLLNEVMEHGAVFHRASKSEVFVMAGKNKRAEVFASSRSRGSSSLRDLKYANVNMLDVLFDV